MTPKEKAEELYYKMLKQSFSTSEKSAFYRAKQCALIAVDEIYYALYNYLKDTDELQNSDREWAYWESVKKEIEKL